MQCRLITEIGKQWHFSQSWHSLDKEYHVAEYQISEAQHDNMNFDELQKLFSAPTVCTRCQAKYLGESLSPGCSLRRIYDSENGKNNTTGDMFYAPWMHSKNHCMYWDNCNDERGHLMVVLPNGHCFDTDARASNCNKPDDRTHRCWEKKGEAPLITIGGPTSDNGVGSIGSPGYHGYLVNGVLQDQP